MRSTTCRTLTQRAKERSLCLPLRARRCESDKSLQRAGASLFQPQLCLPLSLSRSQRRRRRSQAKGRNGVAGGRAEYLGPKPIRLCAQRKTANQKNAGLLSAFAQIASLCPSSVGSRSSRPQTIHRLGSNAFFLTLIARPFNRAERLKENWLLSHGTSVMGPTKSSNQNGSKPAECTCTLHCSSTRRPPTMRTRTRLRHSAFCA